MALRAASEYNSDQAMEAREDSSPNTVHAADTVNSAGFSQ